MYSVNEDEAFGLMAAANWVRDLQLQNVDFELDSKIVVDRYNYPKEDASNFGAIILDLSFFFFS